MGPPDDTEPAWVAPEAAPTIEAAPTAVEPPNRYDLPGADSAVGAAPGVESEIRLPAPLRPMTMGDLLDGGFNVLRARPRIVLGLAAVFVVPVQLVVAWFNRNAIEDLENLLDQALSNAGATPQSGGGIPWSTYLGIAGTSLAQTLVGASLAILVIAWYSGEQPDGREVLRRLKPRLLAVVGGWFFVHVCEGAGIFGAGIGSIAVMALFLVTAPAIAIEGIGPWKGLFRSTALTGGRFWRVLWFGVLSGLVATVLAQILSAIPQVIGYALGEDIGWIALGVGGIINQMVSATVVGASTALLYLDLRIRREGMDVAWAADRLFPA